MYLFFLVPRTQRRICESQKEGPGTADDRSDADAGLLTQTTKRGVNGKFAELEECRKSESYLMYVACLHVCGQGSQFPVLS